MATRQTSPEMAAPARGNHLRLVWALAVKDIVDAVKTKTTLSTIIISLLMVLFYRYFPALTMSSDALRVFMLAEKESELATTLERSPALAVYDVDSRAHLMNALAGAETVELGVVIPETAVAQQQAGAPVTLDGYVMYWLNADQRAELKTMVEADLSAELGLPVTLNLTGHDVYFDADVKFFVFSSTIALLFIVVMIGISLIPNLMVEEKQARTLDALLVSPAAATHLVAGKAIAGLFYGLTGCTVVLLVFRYLIIQWELAILAAVLGTLFMVAVGLLLGSYVQERAQLQLVAWFITIPLLIPVFLVLMEDLVPSGAIAVMEWVPTVLVGQIFRLSLTPNATLTHYGVPTLATTAATLALLALVVWAVRRQDRN